MIRFIICLSLILPTRAIAKEIPVSEGQKLYIQYDGVFMDESTYRDYVFKALRYDDLKTSNDDLIANFEEYKDLATDPCSILELPGPWMVAGIILTAFVVGYASRRE